MISVIKNRILIADDNQDIRQILHILLTGDGYQVVVATNGEEAVSLMDDTIGLVILDVEMPKKSGIVACSEIREKFFTPILFLTAYGQESDKTMGFSAGGDDYITKPFSNSELLLRVKALMRRAYHYQPVSSVHQEPKIVLGDLVVDLDSTRVLLDGEEVSLTTTEYEILKLLITHRKKIFSMEQIYQSIWNDSGQIIGDNAVMVHVRNLRKKIEKDSKNPTYIKTAWGKGYYVD